MLQHTAMLHVIMPCVICNLEGAAAPQPAVTFLRALARAVTSHWVFACICMAYYHLHAEVAHSNATLCADSPWEVGFNLIAGLDNAFILGYSFLIMSFLGWAAGSVLFIVGMCICFYCNCVTGTLHTLGGQRNIHFRDLARVGFGKYSFRNPVDGSACFACCLLVMF